MIPETADSFRETLKHLIYYAAFDALSNVIFEKKKYYYTKKIVTIAKS